MRKSILISVAVFTAVSVLGVTLWQQKADRLPTGQYMDTCTYLCTSPLTEQYKIISRGNVFEIDLIKNAGRQCANVGFPIIHVTTQAPHNAFLQVVYTDSALPELRQFIDAADAVKYPEIYPFYTLNQDFDDAPKWSYSFFVKPVRRWDAHVYAVQMNHEQGTIHCVGGIKWGFEFSYFSLSPQAITPSALTQEDWKKDWEFFAEQTGAFFTLAPNMLQ